MDIFSSANLEHLFYEYVLPFAINAAVALVVFIVGRWIAKSLTRLFERLISNRVDESLGRFLGSVVYALLLLVVVIASLERLGVKTTAAVAVLGAMGLAIGFALQGSLGNFAAGVMLVIFKPFRVGDLVNLAGGQIGTVEAIQIFTTTVITPDNRQISIPNGQVTTGVIENLSIRGTRRLDLVFGVSYADDLDKVKQVIEGVLRADPRVMQDPAPTVAVESLGESSVNFAVRPWIKASEYWDVHFDLHKRIKQTLDQHRIKIPFPQRDVHTYSHPS